MTVIETTAPSGSNLASPRARAKILNLWIFKATWAEWRRRRRYRADLKRLLRVGPYMVDDIGLTMKEAQREIAKPFWIS